MIQTPELQDIITSFVDNLSSTIPTLATTPNSVTREALINPTSTQLAFIFDLAKRISTIQDLFQATGADLDLIAATYGLTRGLGVPSSGLIYLDLGQIESIDTITVNNGTIVRPRVSGSQSASFTVVGSFTFSSTDRAIFEATAAGVRTQLDSVGLQNVTLAAAVPIQASSPGTSGNVGAFSLSSAAIENVNTVINLSSTVGGTDTEGDDSLRQRVLAIFTGNSTGSEAGLLAAATSSTSILNGFVVKFGNPLMTRDGSVYGEDGSLITSGHGRAVDIYVQGSSLTADSEQVVFNIADSNNFLSSDNTLLIGQPNPVNIFGNLPIDSITSITGNESAATFTQGVPTADEEGNILIEGNFALIKDISASDLTIVENLITRERKLATFLNPTSTKYTTIEKLETSDFANSPFSNDKVLFLKQTVDIEEELITRGTFNGADQLRFSNATKIDDVFEERTIIDTIKVTTLTEVVGGFAIELRHKPVVSVNSMINTRLGISIDFEIVDSDQGLVRVISRVPPQQGDVLTVEYVWKHNYTSSLNYDLTGDLIDWVSTADERGTLDNVLLPAEQIQSENILATQPNIASYLEFDIQGLSDREIITTTISGTVVVEAKDHLTLKASDPFTFSVTGTANVGRLFSVTNITKGFDYNLTGYQLNSNKLDSRAGIDTSLLPQQFKLNERANTALVEAGDRVLLGKPSKVSSWSSQADFENNIDSNLSPIYDPTQIDFTSGGVVLKTPLLDTTTTPTTLSGFITQNLTLSGIVEVIDDLIITEGVVVDIEPGTTIKVRPSAQLQNQQVVNQEVIFSSTLVQEDTIGVTPIATGFEEFVYIYKKPEAFASNFFTIISEDGQTLSIAFDQDILTKTITNEGIQFFIGSRAIDQGLNSEIESTIDLSDVASSIKATLLGGRFGLNGQPVFTSALVTADNTYSVLLEQQPVLTNFIQNDFNLAAKADQSITFNRFSYNSTLNSLTVDGDLLEIDGYGDTTSTTNYLLSYSIEESKRLAIIVEGTLRVVGATSQTSVLFTSAADSRAPGDWEGIIFTPKSHTNNSRTVTTSSLNNTRIMFANVGVNVQSSDVAIENCVIRDTSNTGLSVASGSQGVAQYTTDDFDLTTIGDQFVKFQSETRLGYTPTDNIQVARYPIAANLTTISGQLPPLGVQLTETSYVVEMVEGSDYSVYIDTQRVTNLDTSLPSDGYVDHSLEAGKDFMIEFDVNNGYSLVFLYTAGSSKLRRVFDLVVDLEANVVSTGKITVDFSSSINNGLIFDNQIINSDTGLILSTLATTSVNKNTIDNTRVGIVARQSIISLRNNLITNYSTAAISSDQASLIRAQRNDMYSSSISEAEQRGLSDSDILLRAISTSSSTLIVRTPNKFKIGSTIRIDSEEMTVQGINDSSITVARGQNITTITTHDAGASIEIFQLNQIFTVTGLDADFCSLIETDSSGQVNPNSTPLTMRSVAPNTFRASFPVNRRADFYYKYQYGRRGTTVSSNTLVKVFPRSQFGVGINDIVNPLHEIPLASVEFTPNNENFSSDPLYTLSSAADFSFSPLASLASRENPIYGSLIAPNPLHRYVGFIDVAITRNLGIGDTRIPVTSEPLIVSSFGEVSVVGADALTQSINLTIKEFSFNITTEEADQGAVGVLILDDIAHPTGVETSGEYDVTYKTPTDLGTSIPSYYLESEISYVVDLGSEATFQQMVFNKDDIGGEVEFVFQVANNIADLQTATRSIPATASPINIEEVAPTNIGSAIQININFKGNDSSFTPDSTFLFPILEDMSLSFTSAKDIVEYKVLSLIRNVIQNETNLLLDRPIQSDTFNVVGSESQLELFVRKKRDNFDPNDEFLLTTTNAVSIGDTFIKANGDLLTTKQDADPSDIIRVNFLSFVDGEEVITTVADGAQVTQNIYSEVSLIENSLIQDRTTILPTSETIQVRNLSQPDSGSGYKASYSFEAPLDGETLSVSYNYNSAIVEAATQVEARKGIFTDALVKQIKQVPVRIAIALEVQAGAPALSIQSQVSQAISTLFTETFSNISEERRLDTSDIIRATGDISGIETIEVTTMSRKLITGDIESPLIFEPREGVELEEASPRINTIQNGSAVTSNREGANV